MLIYVDVSMIHEISKENEFKASNLDYCSFLNIV